jgi:2-C-methyl-D-erythritol 2,4-cyclodiphosphate synthase
MKACLADVMGIEPNQVSIKATTTEKLGFVGRQEGVSAYCVVLIYKV